MEEIEEIVYKKITEKEFDEILNEYKEFIGVGMCDCEDEQQESPYSYGDDQKFGEVYSYTVDCSMCDEERAIRWTYINTIDNKKEYHFYGEIYRNADKDGEYRDIDYFEIID